MSRSMTCWLGTAGLLLAVPFLLSGCHKPVRNAVQLAQDEAARPIGEPKEFTNSTGMKMVLIPAGEFQMGSKLPAMELVAKYGGLEEAYATEKPIHTVKVAKPFYMAATEVTHAQWKAVMRTSPGQFRGDLSRPVNRISWLDAQEFCKKLSTREEREYRLPTEAEWEYACRAGSTTEYCFDDDDEGELGDYAWYGDNSGGETHPVAQKQPNAWGLYDMHGNVFEWCLDAWHDSYENAPADGSAWLKGGDKGVSVLRDGPCHFPSNYLRCAGRIGGYTVADAWYVGLRVVVSPLAQGSDSPGSEEAKE